ncbi:nucleotide sugar dehydrogenase [Rhodopirellula sp. MGV]|uniref:nucleotide sugar dehydrogenase n=1 Tax=Rhodopirellula sp. MGV TaxID=2023130 RepID=UPI000B97B864|nr:nucleotide sugar dehydrogenase [Rhodopirellula sp. MGV]OYP33015.1 hypothetical protein CGZ80_19190 [Rhodopirellula sp. MGV]PNY35323.1 UDP-glucose/GDP-mannose dehydrogenase family protein [Rhodopirellula baltica]
MTSSNPSKPRVAVYGVGYVGCVTAACLAKDGFDVVGVDIDANKVREINAGLSPVAEPGLAELLSEQVKAGRLTATTSAAEAVAQTEVSLIAVGTPSAADGSVSLDALRSVIETIGQNLRLHDRPHCVVIRSTLLPGILEETLVPLLCEASGRELGPELRVCNNPEFLRESTAIADYYNPPYVVFGVTDDWDANLVLSLYHNVETRSFVVDSRSAAMIKYACNAFHAVKVAFANEIGSLARCLGADGHDVMSLVCEDDKLNISKAYMKPGFAFGGSCLPKDVRALTRFAELEALRIPVLGSLLPSNEAHLRRAISRIEASGCRRIGMVGLSFKAGTDDLRESPFVTLAEYLLGKGFQLSIYDPGITLARLHGQNLAYVDRHLPHLANLLCDSPDALVDASDYLVISTKIGDDQPAITDSELPRLDLRRALALPDLATDDSAQETVPAGKSGS